MVLTKLLIGIISFMITFVNSSKCPTDLTACSCLNSSSELKVTCNGKSDNFIDNLQKINDQRLKIDKLLLTNLKSDELITGKFWIKVKSLAVINSPDVESLDGIIDFEDLNDLAIIQVGINEIPSDIWKLTDLEKVVISNTKLTAVRSGAFGNLPLKILQVKENRYLTSLSSNAFGALFKLVTLVLKRNSLQSFSQYSLPKSENLKEIDLSYNKLTSLTGKIFERVPKLVRLWLNSNRLTTLSLEYKTFLRNNGHLHIIENEVSCNCSMKWLGRTSDEKLATPYNIYGSCGLNSYTAMKTVPLYMLTPEMFEGC